MTNLPVPVPISESVGNYITAALWNAQIYNPHTFLLNLPAASYKQTAAQSIPTGTLTAMTWPTPVLDLYGGYSAGQPTRYTPQVPGYYDIFGCIAFAATSATGNRLAVVELNGAQIAQSSGPAASTADTTCIQLVAPLVFCNGTSDYLELYAVQRSGGSLNTVPALTLLSVRWSHT